MILTTLVFALTLAAATKAQVLGTCDEKSVTPIKFFNYEQFASQLWKYVYFPADPTYCDITSATLALDKPNALNCAYRSTITLYRYNGTFRVLRFQEKYIGEGTVFETALDEHGDLTSSQFKIKFYGYKPNSWVQFYICAYGVSTGVNQDFRFVLVSEGYTLTDDDRVVLKYNDLAQNFRGNVVQIGTDCRHSYY